MNSNRLDLPLLSLKLTVIFGLTWALGFAAALKETAFIWYPFVILNSLQGKCYILTFVSLLMLLNRSEPYIFVYRWFLSTLLKKFRLNYMFVVQQRTRIKTQSNLSDLCRIVPILLENPKCRLDFSWDRTKISILKIIPHKPTIRERYFY